MIEHNHNELTCILSVLLWQHLKPNHFLRKRICLVFVDEPAYEDGVNVFRLNSEL